ncbi:unnamed protein product [Calicophoron daubneyi]|uniref:Uncharacterized protein n=1 Tax=Calicophoron daubneyi TaxID=300641 RepID=A0AAV2T1E2_CALDB
MSIISGSNVADCSEWIPQCNGDDGRDTLLGALKLTLPYLIADYLNIDQIAHILKLLGEHFVNIKNSVHSGFQNLVAVFGSILQSLRHDILSQIEEDIGQVFCVSLPIEPSSQLLTLFGDFIRNDLHRYNPFSLIRSILLSDTYPEDMRLTFILELSRWDFFDRDILPNLNAFLSRKIQMAINEQKDPLMSSSLLVFLTRLSIARLPSADPSNVYFNEESGSLKLSTVSHRVYVDLSAALAAQDYGAKNSKGVSEPSFYQWVLSPLERFLSVCEGNLGDASPGWIGALFLRYVRPLPMDRVSSLLHEATLSILRCWGPESQPGFQQLMYLLAVVETRADLFPQSGRSDSSSAIPFDEIPVGEFIRFASSSYLTDPDSSCIALRIVDVVCCSRSLCQVTLIPADDVSEWSREILPCLKAASHQVRWHALRILAILHGSLDAVVGNSYLPDQSNFSVLPVLSQCLTAENQRLEPRTVRQFLIPIVHLHAHRPGIRNHGLSAEIVLHHLLGLLHIQMTSVWPPIQEAVASFAEPLPQITSSPDGRHRPSSNELPPCSVSTGACKPSEEWKHFTRRLYWSVIEKALQEVGHNVMDSGRHEPMIVEDSARQNYIPYVSALPNVLDLLTDLYCHEPNAKQLPIRTACKRNIDWISYRLSLWRCLRPGSAGRKTRFLTPLFLQTLRDEMQTRITKVSEELLLVMLDLYSKFSNIKSIYQEQQFRSAIYELLTNRRPAIQKAAFQCLVAYKDPALNNYREHIERIIDPQTFRDEIRTFKLDSSLASAEHRTHLAPVFLRILYGRLQLSKSLFAPAIFTNLASCSKDELAQFLELLLYPLLEERTEISSQVMITQLNSEGLVAFIDQLRKRVEDSCLGKGVVCWPKLQALSKVLNHILDYMAHRLGTAKVDLLAESSGSAAAGSSEDFGHSDVLLRLALSLTAMTQTVGEIKSRELSLDSNLHLPLVAQVKKIRSTAVRILGHLFSSDFLISHHFWENSERLEAVQNVCIHPFTVKQLLTTSLVSTNHLILSLAPYWSKSAVLAKTLLSGPGLCAMMSLLVSSKLTAPVIQRLIEIVHNLIFSDAQAVGRKLIRPYQDKLIGYLRSRLKELSLRKRVQLFTYTKSMNESIRLQREFKILGYLAGPGDESSTSVVTTMLSAAEADTLLQGLLALLSKSSVRVVKRSSVASRQLVNSDASAVARELQITTTEAIEAELVRAVTQLVQITDNIDLHLTKILRLFARIDSRVCRVLLCRTVGACTMRLPSFPPDLLQITTEVEGGKGNKQLTTYVKENVNFVSNLCEDALSGLNSWEESRLDQPNIEQRERTFELLSELCALLRLADPPAQAVYLHLGGVSCALHTMVHADLQLRDAALDYCLSVASAIEAGICASVSTASAFYKILIVNCLWSELLRLLRPSQVHGSKRIHLLRLLNGLVHVFHQQSRFAPLALLCDSSSSNNDFFTSLQSGTATRQGQALRRLALFLQNPLTIVSKRQISAVKEILKLRDSDFVIPERELRDLFMPLLDFYLDAHLQSNLEDSALFLEQKRLLEHCLNALGALAARLSWPAYRKLLESGFNKLSQCSNSTLAARIMIILVDAFQSPNWLENSSSTSNSDAPEANKESDSDEEMNKISFNKTKEQPELVVKDDHQQAVLSYMLTVIKRLQVYIAKPHKKSTGDLGNKRNISTFNISLVVCLVMLLRRLPPGYLESRLPHLVLRVIDVLRPSPTLSPRTRAEAIKSLTRIAHLLGPGKALTSLVTLVNQQLCRGYAAKQIRLYTLHRILGEIESAVKAGEIIMKAGQLDSVGRMLTFLYLDELVGTLAEEMDSRRAAGQPISSVYANRSIAGEESISARSLSGSADVDLPEADGLKAPEGLTRLCRLLSPSGLDRLFEDIQNAVSAAAAGHSFSNSSVEKLDGTNEQRPTAVSADQPIGCGTRFRGRALARLEITLSRLPTRNGIFSANQKCFQSPENLLHLASNLINKNISAVLLTDCKKKSDPLPVAQEPPNHGWIRSCSKRLEPKWNYLEIEGEPTLEKTQLSSQSNLTQAHLLVSCGLNILVGVLRYRWLELDKPEHMKLLGTCIPSLLDCMQSKYVRVLGAALRGLNLLLVIANSKLSSGLIPGFAGYLHTAGERLFQLLATHPALLSTKTASTDVYAQQFTSNLYKALASLVRHQFAYPLSRIQLLTLLNAVDIELTRDAATAPSLSLLQAILQRRLRDPSLQTDEKDFLSFTGDPEVRADLEEIQGLVVSKLTDRDQQPTSGAGGGRRLLDLVDRLQHLAITSTSEHLRAEARCCLVTFLLNYPHKAKFVQSFIAFCLRQLEYVNPAGRLSAVSLLSGLIADLPITRLTVSHLDEAILVSVGAAIERESVRSLRVGMLALVRLLFSRLPSCKAESYFHEYLLAFITAPSATRCSARLLGLQLVSAVLDSQPCLTVVKCRPVLLGLLGTEIIPTAALQLNQLILTNPKIRLASGLTGLFQSDAPCPAEELAAAQAAVDDAVWVGNLSCDTAGDASNLRKDKESDEDSSTVDEDQNLSQSNDNQSESDDVEDESDDTVREQVSFEHAEQEARLACESFVTSNTTDRQRVCKSAVENHYFLVCCILEHSLRLVHRLINHIPSEGSMIDTNLKDSFIASTTMVPVWAAIAGFPQPSSASTDESVIITKGDETIRRKKRYKALFALSTKGQPSSNDHAHRSLLCAGHHCIREWSTRCLAELLRVEARANHTSLSGSNVPTCESKGIKIKSAFLGQFRKMKKSVLIPLLEGLVSDSLFQLECDAKEPVSTEWSDALIFNLVSLAQLLHLTCGRKSVLRLFRAANRIALDELNNRPHCYLQRTLAIKLTTSLLLHLPHPDPTDLSKAIKAPPATEEEPKRPLAYVTYLRRASRLLAREFRQRERLVFLAASAVRFSQDDTDAASARARLSGIKLTKEQSARARARRKRDQARLRRALMSGTIRPERAQALVARTVAGQAQTGPDQLVNMIEATEAALTESVGGGDRELIRRICSEAAAGARARRQVRDENKATRAALGVAWTPLSDQSAIEKQVDTSHSAATPPVKRKRTQDPDRNSQPREKKSRRE